MQTPVDGLVQRSEADGFHLNVSINVAKCKELRLTFSRLGSAVAPVTINREF